jgi:hypothetical protein
LKTCHWDFEKLSRGSEKLFPVFKQISASEPRDSFSEPRDGFSKPRSSFSGTSHRLLQGTKEMVNVLKVSIQHKKIGEIRKCPKEYFNAEAEQSELTSRLSS